MTYYSLAAAWVVVRGRGDERYGFGRRRSSRGGEVFERNKGGNLQELRSAALHPASYLMTDSYGAMPDLEKKVSTEVVRMFTWM